MLNQSYVVLSHACIYYSIIYIYIYVCVLFMMHTVHINIYHCDIVYDYLESFLIVQTHPQNERR